MSVFSSRIVIRMNYLALVLIVGITGAVKALDLAPTNVVQPQFQTIPPSDGHGVQYVETVYKATNRKTMVHTVEPLRPSYEVSYQATSLTTINNQTISASSVEFATVLNTTILYNTDMTLNNTHDAATTRYQTLDFMSQKIKYTPVTGDTKTAVTVTETNLLPFV